MRLPLWGLAATLWLFTVARAADEPAWEKIIAVEPFLDDQTVVVAHVDLSRLDLAVARRHAERIVGKSQPSLTETALEKTLTAQIARAVAAGAADLYGVFSMSDLRLGRSEEEQYFLVVPIGTHGALGDEARVREAFAPLSELGLLPAPETIGRALVFTRSAAIKERLRKAQSIRRPEWRDAFQAAGEATARILLAPTADMRRVAEELAPPLPAELGGGSIRTITQGVTWAALAVDVGEKPSLRLVIRSADAAAAKSFGEVLDRAGQFALKQPDTRRMVPEAEKLFARLLPKPAGDQLVLDLFGEELLTLLSQVAVRPIAAAREAATVSVSMNNLKQLAVALHNHHAAHKAFPAPASGTSDKRLLSWRVHILPYIEQESLYRQFHLDEAWDSPHNRPLIAKMPRLYASPGGPDPATGKTCYQLPVGAGTMFADGRGPKVSDIKDGTAQTLMIVETDAERAVEWTRPADLAFDPEKPLAGLGKLRGGSFRGAMADGSVRRILLTIDAAVLRSMFLAGDGK